MTTVPQPEVETARSATLFPAEPDRLAPAREQRAKLAAARRAIADARERYLGCATELEIARTTGAPKERVDALQLRMWELHKPVLEAMERLSQLERKPARKRRR